jgi:antitoxin component of MazEF toxin-antitoxin module
LLKNYEVRKIHLEGERGISRGMTIPHKFLKELDMDSGDYVKIYLGQKGTNTLWIEKLQPPSVPAKKAAADTTEVASTTTSLPTQKKDLLVTQPNG